MDPITLLEELLKIYSPSGLESLAVNYLIKQLRALGFVARVDAAGNAVGTYGDGPRTIMLLGHIDTVRGNIPVRREGDKLWGRGAVDAKGPLACFVAAAQLARPQLQGWRVVVIGAVGEEAESQGALFVRGQYRPDFTIIGEPNGWEHVALGYKGSLWCEYIARRSLAHTSAQQESACEAAVHYWSQVQAWAATHNAGRTRAFDQISPSLRNMNSASDGFTDTAAIKFNVRLPLDANLLECEVTLRELAEADELKVWDSVPAYRSEKNTPLVRAFLAAIRQAGGKPGFKVKNGTSDLNIVGPAWQTPIVAYGPGDAALDHTPEEHILISEYTRAIEILTDTLVRLGQTP